MAARLLRPASFCCCLPVRFGIFALSLVGLVGGILVAATGWSQVRQLDVHPLQAEDETALYLYSATFTVLGAISLFGFIAACLAKRGPMTAYLILLVFFLFGSIATGSYTLIRVFKPKPQSAIERCMNGATDDITRKVCSTGIAVFEGVVVVVYVISWILETYASIIVYSYVRELRGLSSYGNADKEKKVPISNPTPLTMYNSAGAPGINTGYAFSTVQSSFGANGREAGVL